MKAATAQKLAGAIVTAALVADLLGLLGWIHPRRCPVCRERWHAGERCQWAADLEGAPDA